MFGGELVYRLDSKTTYLDTVRSFFLMRYLCTYNCTLRYSFSGEPFSTTILLIEPRYAHMCLQYVW